MGNVENNLVDKYEGRGYLEDSDVQGSIILKWLFCDVAN
jgi:hypothetical protein